MTKKKREKKDEKMCEEALRVVGGKGSLLINRQTVFAQSVYHAYIYYIVDPESSSQVVKFGEFASLCRQSCCYEPHRSSRSRMFHFWGGE